MNKLFASSTVVAAGLLAVPTAAAGHGSHADDATAYCTPHLGIVAQFTSDEPDAAAVEELLPAARDATPAEIAEPVGVLYAGVDSALGGDFSAFDTPEFGASLAEVDAWVFEHCPFDATYEVTAVDWAFGGIPIEVPAGSVAIRLTNAGTEYHEMAIVRKLDGVSQSWDEIVPLIAADVLAEDGSSADIVELVGHAWSPKRAAPGIAFVDLEPGEYAAICFVPIGSVQDKPEEEVFADAEPGYDAHWQHGMVQEFTVVEAG